MTYINNIIITEAHLLGRDRADRGELMDDDGENSEGDAAAGWLSVVGCFKCVSSASIRFAGCSRVFCFGFLGTLEISVKIQHL